MTRTLVKILFGIVVLLASGGETLRAQSIVGPQGPEAGPIRRQMWFIPAHDRSVMMRTLLFRPPGPGPFPLAVVNHGTTQNAVRRAMLRQAEYPGLVQWLVQRGYAVAVPQRPGHGETGGRYFEEQGPCAAADFRNAGHAAAGSISIVVEYLTHQPFVQRTGVLLVGHSAGAWAALALATRNPKAVRAVIAFAPGRGGRVDDVAGRNCAPDRLIAAARDYGAKARVPTLWIYSENDTYFSPVLARQLADAYRMSGGQAEFHMLPPHGTDGHELVTDNDAVAIWSPLVERFLAKTK